jgi:hypothetical protein
MIYIPTRDEVKIYIAVLMLSLHIIHVSRNIHNTLFSTNAREMKEKSKSNIIHFRVVKGYNNNK